MENKVLLNRLNDLVFITGTDTDVGKTIISAALMNGSKLTNSNFKYWKPIQSGSEVVDSETVAELSSKENIIESYWMYDTPASPNQSARKENKPYACPNEITKKILDYKKNANSPLIIEGAGGIFVPLNEKKQTWIDWLVSSRPACLLVARSGLGTLNHTVMSIKLLKSYGIDILGVVLNGPIHEDNFQDLCSWFPDISFFEMPLLDDLNTKNSLWNKYSLELFHWMRTSLEKLYQLQGDIAWLESDQNYCWHPYTQQKTAPAPLPITRANGIWLEDQSGKRYIDGVASWWTNSLGHANHELGEHIRQQQATIDHVLFAGLTHKPASVLSEKLCALSNYDFSKAFYTDNGSCAVEVAIKIALLHAKRSSQTNRNKILSLHGGYHGDTFATMSVGDSSDFHADMSKTSISTLLVSPGSCHPSKFNPEGTGGLQARKAELLEIFKKEHQNLAGVLIEPKVQGAGGMIIQDDDWLRYLDQLCRDYSVPLILDEVFTGMGRCASPFVYQRIGINPAIVCIAKGLTGGILPLAVTLTKDSIYQSFHSDDPKDALYHGHTYTANAIACSAAVKTLEIYERERLFERAAKIEGRFKRWIELNAEKLKLENPRCLGAILAFELPGTSESNDYFHPKRQLYSQKALENNMLLRPLGNTAYFLPPLTIGEDELEFALEQITKTIQQIA